MIRTTFFISLIFVLGCAEGVKTFPTTGKVVYKADGKPFNGLIYFEAVKPPHTRSMAQTNADGTFSLSTVKEGAAQWKASRLFELMLIKPMKCRLKIKQKTFIRSI